MDFAEIETALGQRLEAFAGVPDIAWPNRDFTPNGTYVEFRLAPNDVVDPVISGGFEYEVGIALITVVIPSGGFSNEANALAKSIADWFPKALRLPMAGGNVVINAPTARGTGFPDGGYWRLPLTVRYITE